MWSDKQIDAWIIKRFGSGSYFNRQLIKDLLTDYEVSRREDATR